MNKQKNAFNKDKQRGIRRVKINKKEAEGKEE